MFLRCLRGNSGLLFPGRIILLAPNLARPRPAAPPGAPTRPARGMSGFWIRQVVYNTRPCLITPRYNITLHLSRRLALVLLPLLHLRMCLPCWFQEN